MLYTYEGRENMLAEERYKVILNTLEEEDVVRVSNLIKLFNVSVETVRRDLEFLEKNKLLKRVYGGAIPIVDKATNNEGVDYIDFDSRVGTNVEAKNKIALEAINLISEYDSIALDSGTTTLELAKLLKENFKRLTILTNSLIILNELSKINTFTVISTGGVLKTDEYAFMGDIAVDNISNFNINKSFISASGISLDDGITDWRLEELKIQKKMVDVSKEVIVLADSTKFNSTSLLKICDIEDVDTIVTEKEWDEDILRKYKSKGVNII